jgi:TP901 family phage tail tape measure protein
MAIDSKNYIISVTALLKGDKVVISGLQQIEGATKKFTKTVDVAKTGTQSFDDIIRKVVARALLVAPIWLALRSAMMIALQTIQGMIQANIDLEEGMARIQTVMQGTESEISAQMVGIKRTIIDTSLTTKVSIKDLAEAFYFLKTSALSSEEAMAGFQPLVNILTGTNVKAMEASRGLAGMYNTAGKSLGDNLTVTEKMIKIADVLTYTYAKQDVEMGELIAGYGKVAPYLVGLDDSFTDIVTTIGFLNTHLLRGARAGTLTGQAIINMTKSSKELASIFGITFDSNKPMGFLKTLDLIQKKMGDTSQITTAQSEAIAKISATRGGVPIRLLLGNYDEFKATLKDASENIEGYTKKIADIKMDTTVAQMGLMHNALAVLTNDWLTGATSGQGMVVFLKQLNEVLILARTPVKRLGQEWGYFIDLLQTFTPSGVIAQLLGMASGGAVIPLKAPRSWRQYLKDTEEVAKKTEAQDKKNKETLQNAEKVSQGTTDFKINAQKEYEEELKTGYDLMKANGANELDIQTAKVSEFKKAEEHLNKIDELTKQITDTEELQKSAIGEASYTLKGRLQLLNQEFNTEMQIRTIRENYGSDADYELAKTKEQNDLLVEQVKYRKQITDNMRSVGLDLLKTMGTQESQIITMKMKELDLDRQKMGEGAYLAQMEVLRLSRIQAIVSEKLKERQVQASLILEYQKADEMQRGRIRRTIELRKLSAEELVKAYETSPYDAGIIEQNMGKLKPAQQEAITKMFAEKSGLEYEDVLDVIKDTAKEANPEIVENNQALRDLTEILRSLNTNIGVGTSKNNVGYVNDDAMQTAMKNFAVPNLNFATAIASISINLPDNALEQVAEEAGRKITEELTKNEELAKKIAKLIRPYV